jgi:low temperature requirement protein LtrA
MVIAAGIVLTFGMWWVYFATPNGDLLAAHRDRAFLWAYVHIVVLGAIVATAAGLDAAGFVVEGVAKITGVQAVVTIAAPALVFVCCVRLLPAFMKRPERCRGEVE